MGKNVALVSKPQPPTKGKKREAFLDLWEEKPAIADLCSIAPAVPATAKPAKDAPRKRQRRQKRDNFVEVPEDGYHWHMYGEKPLVGSSYKRTYYRCNQKEKGCLAKKTVDRHQSCPATVRVAYEGKHSHTPPAKTVREVIIYRSSSQAGLVGGVGGPPALYPTHASIYGGAEHSGQSSPPLSSVSQADVEQSGSGDGGGNNHHRRGVAAAADAAVHDRLGGASYNEQQMQAALALMQQQVEQVQQVAANMACLPPLGSAFPGLCFQGGVTQTLPELTEAEAWSSWSMPPLQALLSDGGEIDDRSLSPVPGADPKWDSLTAWDLPVELFLGQTTPDVASSSFVRQPTKEERDCLHELVDSATSGILLASSAGADGGHCAASLMAPPSWLADGDGSEPFSEPSGAAAAAAAQCCSGLDLESGTTAGDDELLLLSFDGADAPALLDSYSYTDLTALLSTPCDFAKPGDPHQQPAPAPLPPPSDIPPPAAAADRPSLPPQAPLHAPSFRPGPNPGPWQQWLSTPLALDTLNASLIH
eukprot:jgi/Mesen1/1310/ME000013S00803